MTRYCKYIIIFILQFVFEGINATSEFFSNHSYIFINEDNGLPHNYISDIFKDSNGFIWFASHNGISRYDGYQFMNYNTQTTHVTLKSNYVNSLAEDRFGRLWVATEEGITILSQSRNETVDIVINNDVLDNLFDSYIQTVYSDRKGNIWVASENNLYCLNLNRMGRISHYYSLPFNTQSGVVSVIDYENGVCAGLDNMLYVITPGKGNKLNVRKLSENIFSFSHDWRILSLCMDGDLLWIGTNRGLFKYDTIHDTVKRYRYSNHKPDMLSQAYITDVAVSGDGHLIVSTLNGLNVYNRSDDRFSFIRQSYREPLSSISCNRINSLLCDGGNIWVGTQMDGVNILTPNIINPLVWKYNDKGKSNFKEPNPVNAITEDLNGNIWIATADGGIWKMERGSFRFENYIFDYTDDESISNNSISGLLVDSHNHLWAYTWGVGINELDLNIEGNRTFIRHEREDNKGLESDFLGSAAEDCLNNGIWFGSTYGLHFYDRDTERFIRIELEGSSNEFREVRAMIVDSHQRLWWGTSEGVFIVSLNSLDKENASVDYDYVRHKLTDQSSRQLEKINCIMQDSKGTIWLGSKSNGLYRLEDDENGTYRFSNYTVSEGLPGNTVIGIVEDSDGYLWISTSRGLSSFDINKNRFTNFTREDGLPDIRFNWNSYYYSSYDNLLYFGTMNEFVAFAPVRLLAEHSQTIPIVTSWGIAGSDINPLPDNKKTDENNRAEVKIHASDKSLTITFSTLDYANSQRIKYAYRLKGYDNDWTETFPGDCVARYSYLPDGEYIFQLKATDERGHWSDKITEMSVIVAPYFFKSWWFYLLVSVIGVCIVRYVYFVKTEIYRRQKKELELQVANRTSELERNNKALMEMAQKVEKVTEEKMSFFTSITHEFRTPVTLINGPLKNALKITDKPEVREQLEIASRNADALLKLVNELMDFRKFDADSFVLSIKNADFISFIDKLIIPFEVFAAERNIKISTYYRMKSRYRFFDEECLRKVIVNLLSNAVKFTPNGDEISLYVFSVSKTSDEYESETDANVNVNGSLVCIDVRDSGCGINPEDTELIFQRFYQSHKSHVYTGHTLGGSGVGLYLCRRIVEMHGGQIYAGNNKRKGAFVRVILPLRKGDIDNSMNYCSNENSIGESRKNVNCHYNANNIELNIDNNTHTILLVDDIEDMRRYLYSILSPKYNVLEASNGKEALEVLGSNVVDLVISDLMMPVMDGNELSRQIKSDIKTSHIPLLLLTAIKSEKQEKLSLEIGVDDYLCKPFDSEMLLLKVQNILMQRERIRKRFSSEMNFCALDLNIESKDSVFMRTAISLMKEHYMDSGYGVDAFIKDMAYSKTLVNSKLHAIAGMTIGQFMKEYRLNQAKAYIQKGDISASVSEIAYSVGFNDPKYFTKCFKELFGKLPSELIKEN